MFVCGGIVWVFFGVHFIGLDGTNKGSFALALMTMSSIGALLLAEGHTAATLVRTYGNAELQKRHLLLSTWVALAFCGLAGVAMCTPALAASLAKLYLLFVPHHFMSQCYGMVRVYCLKQNYYLDKLELWALNAVVRTTVIYAMLRQLTYREWSGTKFLGAPIPFWGPVPEPILHLSEIALGVAILTFAVALVRKSWHTDRTFPLAGILTLLTGMAAFVMGQAATGVYWLYVSAFFHATQYLTVIVACKLKESRAAEHCCAAGFSAEPTLETTSPSIVQRMKVAFPVVRLLSGVVLLSVTIYFGVPRLFQALGCDFGLALVSIFATVNLLHFILDSVLWRLRSAELRRLLS